jgi:hypothetical protein
MNKEKTKDLPFISTLWFWILSSFFARDNLVTSHHHLSSFQLMVKPNFPPNSKSNATLNKSVGFVFRI